MSKPKWKNYPLNSHLEKLSPSATLAINEKSADLHRQGKDIYRLGLGQSPFPVPKTIVEALQKNAHQKDYLPVSGLPQLRQAIADHLSRTRSISYTLDNIMVGPGSKALLFILQLALSGELLLPAPSWVSYAPQAQMLGLPVNWLPTDIQSGWRLQPDVLDDHLRKGKVKSRLLILNYPNNPSGTSYSDTELSELASVARKHQIIVVADEIYWELSFANNPSSISKYYPEGTIVSTGLSKWCGAGGWRLGAMAIPGEMSSIREALATIASETFSAVSAPVQYAAICAFQGNRDVESYLINSRRIMSFLLSQCVEIFRNASIKCEPAEGGFYLLPDFSNFKDVLSKRGIYDGNTLAHNLLQDTGVASLPGSDFGLPNESLVLRIALVDFDGSLALKACENRYLNKPLDFAFAQQILNRPIEAVKRIVNWIGGA